MNSKHIIKLHIINFKIKKYERLLLYNMICYYRKYIGKIMLKKDKLILLDTDAFIDYINGKDIDLVIDIISTSIVFEAPIVISVFTFYELLKNKNESQVYEMLCKIDEIIGGVLHIKGVADDFAKKVEPRYWIKAQGFDYSEFNIFYKELKLSIMKHISVYLTKYFAFVLFCTFIFESIEKSKNVKLLNLFISLVNNKEVIKIIDELIYSLIQTEDFIKISNSDKYRQIYNTLFIFVISLNKLFDESFKDFLIPILTKNRISKVMKLIRNAKTNDFIEIRKLVDVSSYNKFLESIYNKLYKFNEIGAFEEYMLKHIIMKVPYNNGKFDFNDWIDLFNISFININDFYVIYATKERKWRDFIEEYKNKFTILEQCRIIGDEGYLDKKNKS